MHHHCLEKEVVPMSRPLSFRPDSSLQENGREWRHWAETDQAVQSVADQLSRLPPLKWIPEAA